MSCSELCGEQSIILYDERLRLCPGGGMADATRLNRVALTGVWVRLPPRAHFECSLVHLEYIYAQNSNVKVNGSMMLVP